jgi:hypothetical protein
VVSGGRLTGASGTGIQCVGFGEDDRFRRIPTFFPHRCCSTFLEKSIRRSPSRRRSTGVPSSGALAIYRHEGSDAASMATAAFSASFQEPGCLPSAEKMISAMAWVWPADGPAVS